MKKIYLVGTVWDTNNFGKIEIIKDFGDGRSLIKFLDDGTVIEILLKRIRSKEISNPNHKSFLGRGFKGIGKHLMTDGFNVKTKEYNLWASMLRRCYGNGRVRIKSTTCERWHNFQNFCDDLPKLENYDKWVEFGSSAYHLDKDVKGNNSRVYSLETCMFLDAKTNEAQGSRNPLRECLNYPKYEVIKNGVSVFIGNAVATAKFLNVNRQVVLRKVKLKIVKNGLEIRRC